MNFFGIETGGLLENYYDTAAEMGSGSSFEIPRTAYTQTTDAIQSAQPVSNNSGGSWDGFWQNTIGSVVGAAVKTQMTNTSVQANASTAQQQAALQGRSQGNLLLIVAAVVGVVLLTRGS